MNSQKGNEAKCIYKKYMYNIKNYKNLNNLE